MSAIGPGSVSFTGRSGRATFAANTAAGDAAGAPAPEPTPTPAPAPAKKAASKPRLPGLDSLRFFLIAYIAVGHFVAFATRDPFILKLFTQVGVLLQAACCVGRCDNAGCALVLEATISNSSCSMCLHLIISGSMLVKTATAQAASAQER
jgi:hypothetical protein